MTRDVVLELWLEGGKFATIAKLLNESADGVEDAVRMELNRIRNDFQPEASQPPAEARTKGGDSSPRPARNHAAAMRRNPVRKRVAVNTTSLDLTGYPAPLQDPRAEAQRKAYDALQAYGPQSLGDLAALLGVKSDTMMGTLGALRMHNLVVKEDGYRGAWRLTEEVAE